jgi:hypothetical protein
MTDKAIRVLSFSGKTKDWQMWEAKYAARARAKGWFKVMNGEQAVPAHDVVLTDTQVVQQRAREYNEAGYADLLLSMEDEVSFNVVNEARTTELPDGSLSKAWKALHDKYAPTTKSELVELKKEFMSLSISSGEDPEEFISQLEAKNRKIKNIESARAMSDEDVLIHAVACLPSEYDHLVSDFSKRIGASTNALTIDGLKSELREVYRRITKRDERSLNQEQALVAYGAQGNQNKARSGNPMYRGPRRCFNCGSTEHIAANCPKPVKNDGKGGSPGRPQGQPRRPFRPGSSKICKYCGKRGHDEAQCWKKRDAQKLQAARAFLAMFENEDLYDEQANDDHECEQFDKHTQDPEQEEEEFVMMAIEMDEFESEKPSDEENTDVCVRQPICKILEETQSVDLTEDKTEEKIEIGDWTNTRQNEAYVYSCESPRDGDHESNEKFDFEANFKHTECVLTKDKVREAVLGRPVRPMEPDYDAVCMDRFNRERRDKSIR